MFLLKVFLTIFLTEVVSSQYSPTWDSLDSRPNPEWYDEAKIGIFIHWGLYSVPAVGTEWMWAYWNGNSNGSEAQFMNDNYRPNFTYQDFGPQFTAEFYDPEQWAELFEAAGAKYVVLTSKHHEGFTMWPSKRSWNWNSMDVGPKRDIVGELATAIRSKNESLHFGLYYSLYEWYHPIYRLDAENKFQTKYFSSQKSIPELHDLVESYQPDIIWVDGDWTADDEYWQSKEFLTWLFNSSPVKDTVLVNDRWGIGDPCKHGSYYTCADRFNPGVLQTHKWESAMTLDKSSWCYRRKAVLSDYLTIEELITKVAMTISCGGNILIDIGPTHDGRIPVIMEERLRQLGSWLSINGEAVYATIPWKYHNDTLIPGVWYTTKANETTVYGIILNWPSQGHLELNNVELTQTSKISFLGYQDSIKIYPKDSINNATQIQMPDMSDMTSQRAWVIKMENVLPSP